ncbi:hypothetical protein AB0F15_05820 [Amycolatopsis sp. NPDC026612]|uniref:hypothetical protein n=1 Tax=Amycolatopsis sp. NPDC026612 TaxID=3155466 RepID=UPI00340CCF21
MVTVEKTLRVLADYDCWALWVFAPPRMENVDPADPELGLSPALVGELNRWADEYTATLNRDDPKASSFMAGAEKREFVARGRRLAEEVRAQVSPGWRVTYFDSDLGRDDEIQAPG